MEEKVNFTLVGIFVLALAAGFVGVVLWLSSGNSYRTSYDFYQTFTSDSVAGLNLDAPVRYRGVDVGRVSKITLAPNNVEQVQLTLAIERGTPVKVDTLAVLKSQGLTGLVFVELTGGSRESPPLEATSKDEYPVIKSGPSLMTRLDSAISTLLTNLNSSSENFNDLMDEENRRAVKQSLANLEILSRTLAARSAMIDSSLRNVANVMENTSRMSDKLPQMAERVQHSAEAFDRLTSNLEGTADNASRTLDGVQQFTTETLPEVHRLVMELRELTDSLRRFSGDLEQNPSMLIYGNSHVNPGPGE